MIDITKLKTGDILNFECRSSFIANKYTNVKLKSVSADATIARMFTDVDAIHSNVVGDIPDIGPSPDAYNYIVVELIDGTTEAVGIPWIKDNIVHVTKTNVILKVIGASPSDAPKLVELIESRGFTATFTIENS